MGHRAHHSSHSSSSCYAPSNRHGRPRAYAGILLRDYFRGYPFPYILTDGCHDLEGVDVPLPARLPFDHESAVYHAADYSVRGVLAPGSPGVLPCRGLELPRRSLLGGLHPPYHWIGDLTPGTQIGRGLLFPYAITRTRFYSGEPAPTPAAAYQGNTEPAARPELHTAKAEPLRPVALLPAAYRLARLVRKLPQHITRRS